jgi:hypothetical protein
MRKWLRRIRGAIGMAFTWAAVWFAVGLLPRWVFGINADVPFPLVFGVLGFIAGFTFSGLLVLTVGRRSFEQMSLPRFAGWGAMGGFCYRPSSPRPRPLDGETCSRLLPRSR